MDKLLYRGEYEEKTETTDNSDQNTSGVFSKIWNNFITKEFTARDKFLYAITLLWMVVWSAIFIATTLYRMVFDISNEAWLKFWHFWTWFLVTSAVIVTLWHLCGGIRDLNKMFSTLKLFKKDDSDDGWVKKEEEDRES